MYLSVHNFYFILCIPFLLGWLLLFLFNEETRKEQLRMSILFAPIGPVIENLFYFRDYWMPQSIFGFEFWGLKIYLESFLFGFAAFGIATVLYRVIARKSSVPDSYRRPNRPKLRITIFILALAAYLFSRAGINSIFITALASLALSAYMVIYRKDLLLPSIMSGFLFMIFVFLAYSLLYYSFKNIENVLSGIWSLYDTPLGARFAHIPITELLWSFSVGTSIGIFSQYASGPAFVYRRTASKETRASQTGHNSVI